MLDIKQIESFYPEHLKPFKRNLLRQYLQYKILEIVFDSKFGKYLSFMGGTALCSIYSNKRFSEDLDFDNRGLKESDFEELVTKIKKKLHLQGYTVETKNVYKKAFRSYIRIPKVLFENGLSDHEDEKMLIELDTEPQNFDYCPHQVILNKFDVFLRINVVPIDILLSQKLFAILMRRRALGRDFYDTVFLMGKTEPNFDYLKQKLNIGSMKDLKDKLLIKCKNLEFKKLANDVEPFLFSPDDLKKVIYFRSYIKQL
jgi:predicted nucleotidyltransferase component of viral defense system